MVTPTQTKRLLLDYEIRSAWWPQFIGTSWGHAIVGHYFAWKVNRKYRVWMSSHKLQDRTKSYERG